MSVRLDAIIFGATGFTGKTAVENALEAFQGLQWGIAGRNLDKLKNLLKEVGNKVEKDLSYVPIIIADVEDEKSIKEMASKCKIIVNCCGPYLLYGEVVVKACIEAGTHYVDVTGETQFFDGMTLKYHELAKEKHSYVIPSCGFCAIPVEMGVVYAENNFPGTVNSIEAYWENFPKFKDGDAKALFHFATLESMVSNTANSKELIASRLKMKPLDYPNLKPTLKTCSYPHKVPSFDGYFLRMMGDGDVVRNTQYWWHKSGQKRPIQFENYVGIPSTFYAILAPILMAFVTLLIQFSWTREIVLKFPKLFTWGLISHDGPTKHTMDNHYFHTTFKAKGWAKGQSFSEEPKLQLWTRLSGYNPFYDMTATVLMASAKTILQETDKLPGSGGVITPGYAFAKTNLIEDLQKYKWGIKFEVLKLEQ